jgi:hypothetical protein
MSIETMIASPNSTYKSVASMSDAYVPACDVWVGYYPFLDKKEFLKLSRSTLRSVTVSSAKDESAVEEKEAAVIEMPLRWVKDFEKQKLVSRKRRDRDF